MPEPVAGLAGPPSRAPAEPFAGAVLCGGRSARMGADKAMVLIGGAPMARRVADALAAAGASPVVAIGGDEAALVAAGIDVHPDRHPGEGPLGAVSHALDVAAQAVVAVLACDLVQPAPALITLLVERRADADADVAVPVADGRPQWTHGVWHRRAQGLLADVFSAGERSLVGATAGLRVALVAVEDPEAVRDADRPADLPEGARWPGRP